jgi:hypothetical protein
MLSQKTQIETKIADKDHTYQCPNDSSLIACLEALNTFRSYIYGRIKENEEIAKAQAEAQGNLPASDEVKPQ